MKKLMAIALMMAATTAYGASLDMAVAGTTGDYTGNTVEFVEGAGGTFDFSVSVDPTPGTYFKGLSLFLTMSEDVGAEISARNIHGVNWAWGPYVVDPTTADGTLFSPKNREARALNVSTGDLGATTNNPAYGDPAGELMTLQIMVPQTAPVGSYTIVADGSTYVENEGAAGNFDSLSSFVVTITPEPASLALLALGGLALVRRR